MAVSAAVGATQASDAVRIAPVPAWVAETRVEKNAWEVQDSGGVGLVLMDRQLQVEPRESFHREIRRITSETGVQHGAAFSVTFDPAYQAVVFHEILLTRNGRTVSRLARDQIKLFQRERELERFIYDGSFTAQYDVPDVRVGDAIQFSYTVTGANPVKDGRCSIIYWLDFSYPVGQSFLRIVHPENRSVAVRLLPETVKAAISTRNGTTEIVHREQGVAARRFDGNLPVDYDPRRAIQISEFETWAELARWGAGLFARGEGSLSAELQAEVGRLQQLAEPEAQVLEALRFVQDEVRYLGFEAGENSHRPTPPAEVLRRRFGDCKDKTLLLATLLRECGIAADPALVSNFYRRTTPDYLPAPEFFDHVILRVRVNGKTRWLDATRSKQRGPLSQIYVPDFGHALVLTADTTSLTTGDVSARRAAQEKDRQHFQDRGAGRHRRARCHNRVSWRGGRSPARIARFHPSG